MMDMSQNNFLIQALSGYAKRIEQCVTDMPDEMLVWQPAPTEWSVQMVMAHLLHCEPLYRRRLARIVAEDHPSLPGFGPEQAPPIAEDSFPDLLAAFDDARRQTLSRIYDYSPEDWERPAFHKVQGATTLKAQIRNMVDHDMEHLGQIHDLCELWQKQTGFNINNREIAE